MRARNVIARWMFATASSGPKVHQPNLGSRLLLGRGRAQAEKAPDFVRVGSGSRYRRKADQPWIAVEIAAHERPLPYIQLPRPEKADGRQPETRTGTRLRCADARLAMNQVAGEPTQYRHEQACCDRDPEPDLSRKVHQGFRRYKMMIGSTVAAAIHSSYFFTTLQCAWRRGLVRIGSDRPRRQPHGGRATIATATPINGTPPGFCKIKRSRV